MFSLRLLRIPLMAIAMLTLLSAAWAGLLRLGWQLPVIPALQSFSGLSHGPLMICGFLGVLISLERAVALSAQNLQDNRRLLWPFLSPLLTGMGSLAIITGLSGLPGPLFVTLGSAGLLAVYVVIIRRHSALFTMIMGLGALSWLIGNVLWLTGQPIPNIVLWWVGFPLLTIVGERLELSRLVQIPPTGRAIFLVGTGIFLIGAALAVINLDAGVRLAGIGELILAFWLNRYDIARNTIRRAGLPRFIAICLLAGYFWLGLGGALALWFGGVVASPYYDAILHTVFVGFVFSMIFGHAPIILPAVINLPMAFRPAFYAHLALLHISLSIRIAGDLVGQHTFRQWGGMLNVIALLLFLASTVYGVLSARKAAQAPGLSPLRSGPNA
jgi:hypothetical protein